MAEMIHAPEVVPILQHELLLDDVEDSMEIMPTPAIIRKMRSFPPLDSEARQLRGGVLQHARRGKPQ
jgi:hypothetical protein